MAPRLQGRDRPPSTGLAQASKARPQKPWTRCLSCCYLAETREQGRKKDSGGLTAETSFACSYILSYVPKNAAQGQADVPRYDLQQPDRLPNVAKRRDEERTGFSPVPSGS